MAGVELRDIQLPFAWQVWPWRHWVWSGGALGPDWSRGDAAALCVAGMALGDIHLPFAWQAWNLETSNCHLRGRCGTGDTGQGLVARLDRIGRAVTQRHFAWQARHSATSTSHLRGRRGTWRHQTSICVAGVALETLGMVWWRAWTGLVARLRRGTLRGRCGTRRHPPTISRGRRGTWRPPFSFCVAGTGLALVSHTIFLTHHLSQTALSHTIFDAPSFKTLSHTILSHTIFHTPSFTPHFVTYHL